jgi:hypothetical protein
MKTREPEPLEQIDYGRDYQSRRMRRHSPSSNSKVIQIESLGKGAWVLVAASMVMSSLALAIAYASNQRSDIAEREARIAQDKYFYLAADLRARGIEVTTDDHP